MPSPFTTDEMLQLVDTFMRHITDLHNADFEVCDDPGCVAVRDLDKRLFADEGDNSPYAEHWQAK